MAIRSLVNLLDSGRAELLHGLVVSIAVLTNSNVTVGAIFN